MVVYNGGDPQKRFIDSKLYKYRVQKPWIKAVQSDGVFLQQAFVSETINFEREIRRVWTYRSINWMPYGIRKMIALEFTEVLQFRSRLEAVIKDINQLKKVFFNNLGQFHTWDDGKSWNPGGFNQTHLSYFISLAESITDCEVIETGSGNSTIAFLLANPKKLDSVSPDFELWSRIEDYCRLHQVPTDKLNPIKAKSEWALPSLAVGKNGYDIGLIDGCHGWPTTFVDLYYIYFMLRKNGYLIIDDIQLHSIKEIANFLVSEVDRFELVINLGKTLVFRKLTDELELGEWDQQRYIVDKTDEARNLGNKFALYSVDNKNYAMFGFRNGIVVKGLVFIVRACAWILTKIQGKFQA